MTRPYGDYIQMEPSICTFQHYLQNAKWRNPKDAITPPVQKAWMLNMQSKGRYGIMQVQPLGGCTIYPVARGFQYLMQTTQYSGLNMKRT